MFLLLLCAPPPPSRLLAFWLQIKVVDKVLNLILLFDSVFKGAKATTSSGGMYSGTYCMHKQVSGSPKTELFFFFLLLLGDD